MSYLSHGAQFNAWLTLITLSITLMSCGPSQSRLVPGSLEEPVCPTSAQRRLKVDHSRANPAKIDWVAMPPGRYFVERFDDNGEIRKTRFNLKGFEVSKSVVTVAQFKRCVKAKGCYWDQDYPRCYDFKKKKMVSNTCPMVNLALPHMMRFARWAGGRLISMIEWRYTATSGGCKQLYPWGNKQVNCSYANLAQELTFNDRETRKFVTVKEPRCRAKPNQMTAVCLYPKGHNAQGVCDLVGNVRERTGSLIASLDDLPRDGGFTFRFDSSRLIDFDRNDWKKRNIKLENVSFEDVMASPFDAMSKYLQFSGKFYVLGSAVSDQKAEQSLATYEWQSYYAYPWARNRKLQQEWGFRVVRPLSKQKKK